jgi:putative membrane protein
VIVGKTKKTDPSDHPLQIKQDAEFEALAITIDDAARSHGRGVRWGMLFWIALGGLLLLAICLATTGLVTDLFARNQELGWIGFALAILAAVSLIVISVRETIGMMRLAALANLRERSAEMILTDNRVESRKLVRDLLHLTRRIPRLARGRANLEGHLAEIIDGSDIVRLAERELMAPLDQQARKLVGAAAARVSVVTALSPRAIMDLLFVLATALSLVRRLAFLYGVRPGTFGLGRLMRHVITHLAMTGGLAASDSLLQQMLGHGVAAKLSARLGEGVLNGLLTARFGLAAIDIIRPMPFAALPRPTVGDLMGDVLGNFGGGEERQSSTEPNLSSAEVR